MSSISISLKMDALRDIYLYKKWLLTQSCTRCMCTKGSGFISSSDLTLVNCLFSKKIKLFCNYGQKVSLVTEDGEYYSWIDTNSNAYESIKNLKIFNNHHKYRLLCTNIDYYAHIFDWSNTRIKKCAVNKSSFLALTDDEEIYYSNKIYNFRIHKRIIENKITCFGCGDNFYVIVTDNNKIYSWGAQYDDHTSKCTGYSEQLCEMTELSGKTIVKIVCGSDHILVLTDKGNVYAWGLNRHKQSNINSDNVATPSPTVVKIPNVKKISDIAVMKDVSIVKSSEDGFIYIWGLFNLQAKILNCEYTNMFDVCNVMSGQSPISMADVYTEEDTSILTDLADLFNDCSTSDLTIKVKEQPIYVHKAILRIRSLYFSKMFDGNWKEATQSVVTWCHHSYTVYVTFLRYLYTGMINQSSMSSMEELLDLLKLADAYFEENLERDCIWMIKKKITASNVIFVHDVAVQYNKEELKKYCLTFIVKNITTVKRQESFGQMASDAKETLLTKIKDMYPYIHLSIN